MTKRDDNLDAPLFDDSEKVPPPPPAPPPPRLLNDDVGGPSGCFWGHRWGKWETYEKGTISRGGSQIGSYEYQKRYCERCNKVELNQQQSKSV